MKRFIKKIIIVLFGENFIPKSFRLFYKILSFQKNIVSSYDVKVISQGYHTGCGYYDWDPIRNNNLLFYSANKNLSAGKIVLKKGNISSQVMSNGRLFNWQQANRLQWITKDSFIYNDLSENDYISYELRLEAQKKSHQHPI